MSGEQQQAEPIVVWEFRKAPQEYRDLSPYGGDEDWLAVLPADYKDYTPGWIYSGSGFGCCDVSTHELPDGRIVCIGAHA
jgi:hypothetical protein